jgi:hypothetical protein
MSAVNEQTATLLEQASSACESILQQVQDLAAAVGSLDRARSGRMPEDALRHLPTEHHRQTPQHPVTACHDCAIRRWLRTVCHVLRSGPPRW